MVFVVIVGWFTPSSINFEEVNNNSNDSNNQSSPSNDNQSEHITIADQTDENLSDQDNDESLANSKIWGKLVEENPNIKIENGTYRTDSKSLGKLIEENRSEINNNTKSIGKVEFKIDSNEVESTGFVVANGIVLIPYYLKEIQSTNKIPRESFIDFREKIDSDKKSKFSITKIISVNEELKIALVEVEKQNYYGQTLPLPLLIADKRSIKINEKVYLIGYPLVNNGAGKNKYFQPCLLLSPNISTILNTFVIRHNCFTAPGNMGSPLIDLRTNRVIGVHLGGLPTNPKGSNEKEALLLLKSSIDNLLTLRK